LKIFFGYFSQMAVHTLLEFDGANTSSANNGSMVVPQVHNFALDSME